MALNTAIRLSAEERAWAYHLSMDRAEADYRNGIKYARLDALEEGKKQGREEKARETARNMLARNYPVNEIAEITGLTLADIARLSEMPVSAPQ